MFQDDGEFSAHFVRAVSGSGSGWSVTFDNGWSLFVGNELMSVAPSVGEVARLYGRGLGYPVRGVVIGSRVYRYQSKEDHDAEMKASIARENAEQEAADQRFREGPKPPLAEFAIRDRAGWEECVRVNSADPYSYECCRYAAAWAALMDSKIAAGAKVADIAKDTSHEADTDGITGFMFSVALSILYRVWAHGDELKEWRRAT